MIGYRHACLSIAVLCSCAILSYTARAQNAPAQQTPPQPPAQQQPPAQPTPQNPFETVPKATQPQQQKPPQQAPQQQPPLEAPKPAEQPKPQPGGPVIENIVFTGARRVPQDTLRALISTKKGDIYNE